jgi:transcriptional regulator with XRE-family HTH domain
MSTSITATTSPASAAATLGQRLKQTRLNRNLTQDELAAKAGLSRQAVVNAEAGKAQLQNFVALLCALQLAEQLNNFLPEPPLSPIQLARLQGRQRKHATGKTGSRPSPQKDLGW